MEPREDTAVLFECGKEQLTKEDLAAGLPGVSDGHIDEIWKFIKKETWQRRASALGHLRKAQEPAGRQRREAVWQSKGSELSSAARVKVEAA